MIRKFRTFFAVFGVTAALCLSLNSAARSEVAPLLAPGDAVLSHVDLLVSDVKANQKFWVAMGGTPATWGNGPNALEGVTFGNVRIVLHQADNVGPAIGSGINHIGLYVPDVQKAIAGWKAIGLKTESGRNAQQSFVWSPNDLIRVEILEMPNQVAPEIFHHVHYYVYSSSAGGIPEMQAWYARMFAAIPGKRGAFETDNLPGGELTFAKSNMPTIPTAGRAIDHVGFDIKDLDAYCKKLQSIGVKLDTPYTEHGGMAQAFLTDPWGNRIELDEALTPPH